jgi:hypothetical protein
MTMEKLLMMIKCIWSAVRFDGYGVPPVQYEVHCPMQHVQGYSGSHWMPPLGNYSLRIAPGATRATGKQTTINKYTYKAGHFDCHCNAPGHNRAHRPMEEVQGFTRSNWMPPSGKFMSNNIKRTWLRQFFNVFHCQNCR